MVSREQRREIAVCKTGQPCASKIRTSRTRATLTESALTYQSTVGRQGMKLEQARDALVEYGPASPQGREAQEAYLASIDEREEAESKWNIALAHYASTAEGAKRLRADADSPSTTPDMRRSYETALDNGVFLRAAHESDCL